jgi:hypothetical protein
MNDERTAKFLRATVASVDEGRVVLDVDGETIKLPASLLPAPPREGDGFVITITAAPAEKGTLQQRVIDRLEALTAGAHLATPPPAADEDKPRE